MNRWWQQKKTARGERAGGGGEKTSVGTTEGDEHDAETQQQRVNADNSCCVPSDSLFSACWCGALERITRNPPLHPGHLLPPPPHPPTQIIPPQTYISARLTFRGANGWRGRQDEETGHPQVPCRRLAGQDVTRWSCGLPQKLTHVL